MKRLAQRGFTLVEIMIVVAIIALLAAIAIPNVLRGRTTANESAAIGNLRAVVSSLEMFRSVNQIYPVANGLSATAYTTTATALWGPAMYGAGATTLAACVTGLTPDPDFGPPSFCIAMTGTSAAGGGLMQGFGYFYAGVASGATYSIVANPVTVGSTGTRSFFINETGLIRHCTCTAAGCVLPITTTAAGTLQADSADSTIDTTPLTCT